ncbi:MAG: methyl-accepting chemotaxis protein [Treponemataceae bacterium]
MNKKAKIFSIRKKLLIFLIPLLGLVLTIKCIRDSIQQYGQVSSTNAKIAKTEAKVNAEEILNILDRTYTSFVSLEQLILMELNEPIADRKRKLITDFMASTLLTNTWINNIGVYFEPNAFDGRDSEFTDLKPYDEVNGRFVPRVWRQPGATKATLECTKKLNGKTDPEWYTEPLNSDGHIMLEPYINIANGIEQLFVTFATPIIHNGRVLGVINVDIDITNFQKFLEDIGITEDKFPILCTDTGYIIAHGFDPSQISKNELILNPAIEAGFQKAVRDKNISELKALSTTSKVESVYFLLPMQLSGVNKNWVMLSVNSSSALTKAAREMTISTVFEYVIIILLISVLLYFISRNITRPLNRTVEALQNIAEGDGDLTVRLPVRGNDELTQMSAYFNKTMEKIRTAIKKVGGNTVSMQELGGSLSANMNETASAVNQISSNIEGVKSQIINQAASVTETSATMEEIIRTIEQLNTSIESQAASVTQSSASIEEMVANIASITESLNENNKAMGNLAEQIEAGRNGAVDTNNFVKQMSERSDALSEAASVIQNIASQTNLLAMNAAIEAAHAGDSGKGFAVVADEIRKLAEESNNQGKQIANMIKETLAIIVKMTKAGKDAEEIFNRVYEVSEQIANREQTVVIAMQEQDRGNKEVLETIKTITEVTSEVKGGSAEMLSGGQGVAKEMQKLDELTRMITDSMNEMASGVVQINNAVQEVQAMAHENKNAIDSLNGEVGKFKV